MISSMTAFSRASIPVDSGLLTLEIQSLNRKHLEIHTILPREFLEFDSLIKKQIQKRLSRGKLQVYLSFIPNEKGVGIKLVPNLSLAKEIRKGWETVSKHLGIQNQEDGLVKLLTRESGLFATEFPQNFSKEMEANVFKIFAEALDGLCKMRETEGSFLKTELEKRREIILEILKKVEKIHDQNPEKEQEKLEERLAKLLDNKVDLDDRFLREVALLVDRSDITEELIRIESHLKQFKEVLEEPKKGHGKMLDFIFQELNREWNTIGAKCSDHDISQHVLKAKCECEKIREQIHNVE